MRMLLYGEFFVNIGRAIILLTFAKYLYDETGELWAFSTVFLVQTILSFAIPLVAGTAIDSKGSSVIIRNMSFLGFVSCIISFVLLDWHEHSIVILLITSVLLSIANPFIKLSVFTLTPELSKPEELEKNNGKLSFSFQSGQIIGMGVCALLLKYTTLINTIFVVALMFFLAFTCYFLATNKLQISSTKNSEQSATEKKNSISEVFNETFSLCKQNGAQLFIASLDFQLVAIFNLLLVALVFNFYNNNPFWLSGLDACFAIGAIIGGLIVAKGLKRNKTRITDTLITQGIFLVFLLLVLYENAIYLMPVLLVFFGVALSFSTVYWNTTFQKNFPKNFKGRLGGARNLLSSAYISIIIVIISFFHNSSFLHAIVACIVVVITQIGFLLFYMYSKKEMQLVRSR